MPDDDDIKKKAREGLSPTADYESERHKLSSKGRRPDYDEYYDAYLDWIEETIVDKRQMTQILATK